MSQPGLGVMIGMLGGNKESVAAFQSALNKTIQSLKLDDDANDGSGALRFVFTDGSRLRIMDGGQSCCENRYMHTDDDLDYHVGAVLLGADVQDGPEVDYDYGVHETAFLHVTTSKGTFVVATHNEHNGYYGGFFVIARAD